MSTQRCPSYNSEYSRSCSSAFTNTESVLPVVTVVGSRLPDTCRTVLRSAIACALVPAAQAIADLNTVRQVSGNLDPTTVTTGSTDSVFVNALLHERLYSLLYEGHRWVDMRRYGRLNQMIIDRPSGCPAAGIPKDTVFSTLPINSFEVDA